MVKVQMRSVVRSLPKLFLPPSLQNFVQCIPEDPNQMGKMKLGFLLPSKLLLQTSLD